jgi:hypothetical protein
MVARFVAGSIRLLAELTGGMASVYDYADKSLSKIAQATASGYLLGYYPSNTAFDGRFRRVTVKVKKPGATVLYRHGYLADPPKTPLDRRQSITYSRIASAVNYSGALNDVPFRLNTSTAKGANRVRDFVAEITVDPSRVTFSEANGIRAAELDVSVLCQDERRSDGRSVAARQHPPLPNRVGSGATRGRDPDAASASEGRREDGEGHRLRLRVRPVGLRNQDCAVAMPYPWRP